MPYTELAKATPFEGAPAIHIASIIGASPKKPLLFKIPTTGERPVTHCAKGLPKGVKLEGAILSGAVEAEGTYEITLTAENALGKCERRITLVIAPGAILLTPLLGFTSWNAFAYPVTQEKMEHTARRMCETGLSEYGYSYVNIDSGWQGEYGGKYDAIQPNEKFPDLGGMCDRLHAMGFKCGIYSTPMIHAYGTSIHYRPLPLGCTQGEPDDRFAETRDGIGVIRKEKNNALQWAEWGFDYLKYDWSPTDTVNAEAMRSELATLDRDFGFCVTTGAKPEYHRYWQKHCNSYRHNPDSVCTWENLMKIYHSYFDFIDYVNRGHFFDLDMLDLGECDLFDILHLKEKPDFGFSEDEAIVAYTMRAFFASPIQISCHLDNLSDFDLSLFCNDEIIAINQDALVSPAVPTVMMENGDKRIHVFRKRLEDGSIAYAVFNLGKTTETFKLYLDGMSEIRDVWAKRDLDPATTITLTKMPPHTVRVFKTVPSF